MSNILLEQVLSCNKVRHFLWNTFIIVTPPPDITADIVEHNASLWSGDPIGALPTKNSVKFLVVEQLPQEYHVFSLMRSSDIKNSKQLAKAGFEPPIIKFWAQAFNHYAIPQLGELLHFSLFCILYIIYNIFTKALSNFTALLKEITQYCLPQTTWYLERQPVGNTSFTLLTDLAEHKNQGCDTGDSFHYHFLSLIKKIFGLNCVCCESWPVKSMREFLLDWNINKKELNKGERLVLT